MSISHSFKFSLLFAVDLSSLHPLFLVCPELLIFHHVFGGSFRITLVVGFDFCPKILGTWCALTNIINRYVFTKVDELVTLLRGGGDISTLHAVIRLVGTFCTQRCRGRKNIIFAPSYILAHLYLHSCLQLHSHPHASTLAV